MNQDKILSHPVFVLPMLALIVSISLNHSVIADELKKSHIIARMDPLHFKPAIETASNEQCLACHQEILGKKPLDKTLSGVKTVNTRAWYQTVNTYEGEQDSFHRRHLLPASGSSPVLMKLQCITCHQGHNANKQVSSESHRRYWEPSLLKQVDTDICLMCHGKFDFETMPGVIGPWEQTAVTFNNDCMVCHKIFRTNAHNVNYLNKDVIEQAGTKNGEVCFGCHGGRSWYRIAYPYARNAWPGMSLETPDWASNRPTQSEARFLTGVENPVNKTTK